MHRYYQSVLYCFKLQKFVQIFNTVQNTNIHDNSTGGWGINNSVNVEYNAIIGMMQYVEQILVVVYSSFINICIHLFIKSLKVLGAHLKCPIMPIQLNGM